MREMVEMGILLTLDIDKTGRKRAFRKARLIKAMFRCFVWIRKSSGNKGWHIKAIIPELDYNEILKIRKMVGDDPRRVWSDRKRHEDGICTDILFSMKVKNGKISHAGKWEEI